jgi:hypothetical protein
MFSLYSSRLDLAIPYSQFIVFQRYEDETFDFFSGEEILQFMLDHDVCPNDISWEHFSKIFKLGYQQLTFECLEALLIHLKCYDFYRIKPDIIHIYLQANHNYYIFSDETVRLVKLVLQHNLFTVRDALHAYHWILPADNEVNISVKDMIFLYRLIDQCLIFPNNEKREEIGRLLLVSIQAISIPDEKIAAIEQLLLLSKRKTDVAISDVRLRNQLMDLWVEYMAVKYGRDNSSEQYYLAIKGVIDRIGKFAAASDRIKLLSSLADRIQAQWKVSERMGILLEPDKFLDRNEAANEILTLTALAAVSRIMGKEHIHQRAFLEFLSKPLNNDGLNNFANYLRHHHLADEIMRVLNQTDISSDRILDLTLYTLYLSFWDRSLQERAVVIEYLLIPVSAVISDQGIRDAYAQSLAYVCENVFPDSQIPNSDDELACSFLCSYLDATEAHLRSFLLAGLLVASNQVVAEGQLISAGKKLILVAEYLGPAYVKIIQAIDSHPDTPPHIRADTHHAKSRANPPHRWNMWRMIMSVLSEEDRNKLSHVGELLGSASYNMGIKVRLKNGRHVVLSMLRENAELDANHGFDQLMRTVENNAHPRMQSMRQTGLAMIHEAQAMSQIEMNHELSARQYELARRSYGHQLKIGSVTVQLYPVGLLKSGYGYRFIELVRGVEFNRLPVETPAQIQMVRGVAKAVMCIEFINIFRGAEFDSDRHGNQLCVFVDTQRNEIRIGLYDFGEMSLTPANENQIQQFIAVIHAIFGETKRQGSFNGVFDNIITQHIEAAQNAGNDTSYLMRIRKGLLALQDFQRHLNRDDLLEVILKAGASREIHPEIRAALSTYRIKLSVAYHSQRLFNRAEEAVLCRARRLLSLSESKFKKTKSLQLDT